MGSSSSSSVESGKINLGVTVYNTQPPAQESLKLLEVPETSGLWQDLDEITASSEATEVIAQPRSSGALAEVGGLRLQGSEGQVSLNVINSFFFKIRKRFY